MHRNLWFQTVKVEVQGHLAEEAEVGHWATHQSAEAVGSRAVIRTNGRLPRKGRHGRGQEAGRDDPEVGQGRLEDQGGRVLIRDRDQGHGLEGRNFLAFP